MISRHRPPRLMPQPVGPLPPRADREPLSHVTVSPIHDWARHNDEGVNDER